MGQQGAHASKGELDDDDQQGRDALNPDADEVYQFTCSASPGGTLVVRLVRTGDEVMLIGRERRLFDPERLWSKRLSATE